MDLTGAGGGCEREGTMVMKGKEESPNQTQAVILETPLTGRMGPQDVPILRLQNGGSARYCSKACSAVPSTYHSVTSTYWYLTT